MKNQNSMKIFSWFEKKYNFGELGLFEAIAVASLHVKNISFPLSSVIIAPPGEGKTDTLKDLKKIFPNDILILKGLFTEYGIYENYKKNDLDNKLWCVSDLIDTVTSQPQRRVAGILSFLKNSIDGEAEILIKEKKYNMKLRVGILMNIPEYSTKSKKIGGLVSTTFLDRCIPFTYRTDWEAWSEKWMAKTLKNRRPEPITITPREVKIPAKYEERLLNAATYIRKCKFYSGLPRNLHLAKAILCGNALLNNRKSITNEDFIIFNQLKGFFRWKWFDES